MKKLGIILVLIGIICCGGGAYLAYTDETTNNIKDISSYESYEYSIDYTDEGIYYKVKVDLKNNISYYEISDGEETNSIYSIYNDGNNKIMYVYYDNWYYEEYEEDDDDVTEYFHESFSEFINATKGNIDTDSEFADATVTDNGDNSYKIAEDDISLLVIFDSDGYLKKVEYSVASSSTECEDDTDCVSVATSGFIIEFSNINNVSLSIPDEVKNNAVPYDLEYEEAYEEILTDEDTILDNIDYAISEVITNVNSLEYGALSDESKLYYIQMSGINSCSSTEYDNLGTAYVVVHYDSENYSYKYYFTFYNDDGDSLALTETTYISSSSIVSQTESKINSTSITKQIPEDLTSISEDGIVIINKTTSCKVS